MKKVIKKLIESKVSAAEIERQTGVSESVIRHLRKGRTKLGNITLDNAENLYNYALTLNLDEDK